MHYKAWPKEKLKINPFCITNISCLSREPYANGAKASILLLFNISSTGPSLYFLALPMHRHHHRSQWVRPY
ncbi:hypothetical protein Scep_026353 [Stephania cephalantha]|uniref:Uncharacterized protein n=1 Tax=Stephania cephalantha TaxID=152367 RepID=A0AAP0ETV1_9MAGN